MPKSALQTNVYVCAAGAFGVFFRWLQLQLAFEEGLARRSLWNWIVPLSILAAAWLFRRFVEQYRSAHLYLPQGFHGALKNAGFLFRLARWGVGGLMCLGALVLVAGSEVDKHAGFLRLLAGLGALSGLSVPLLLGLANRPDEEQRPWLLCLLSVLPILFYAAWLVYCYQVNSINSVIWAYVIEVLTLCVVMLAFFRVAGFAFAQYNAEKALRYCMLGAFLCLMSLADERSMGLQLMLLATAGTLVLYNWIMIDNLAQGAVPPAPEKPSDGFERL